MKYCADRGFNQVDVEDFKLPDSGSQIVIVKYIDGKDAAKQFCDGFVSENTSFFHNDDGTAVTNTKAMVVSDDNLSRITDAAALEAYYYYYISNY
jgi:hypothetical protein